VCEFGDVGSGNGSRRHVERGVLVKETEVVRGVGVSLECLANAAVGNPTVKSANLTGRECIDLDYCSSYSYVLH
jgi:hypothetical protein